MPHRLGPLLLAALLSAAAGCGGERAVAPAPEDPAAVATVSAAAFRDRVLEILAVEFPAVEFAPSADPLILRHDDAELHLGNLRTKCAAAGGVDSCREVVRLHFATLLESLALPPESAPLAWLDARAHLRPQLAPAEYLEETELAHRPFGEGLIVAFVLDAEKNYRFVTGEDLARWSVSLAEVEPIAMQNLEAASREIPVQAADGADRLLAVEVGDGYDATRLLLPGFRRFASAHLGERFLAAIPNRDVLVMWSESGSAEFQASVRARVEESFRSEPYPLSRRLFRVEPEGVRELPQ